MTCENKVELFFYFLPSSEAALLRMVYGTGNWESGLVGDLPQWKTPPAHAVGGEKI